MPLPPVPRPLPVAELAERLIDRLHDDETLRGNLTDSESAALLRWASGQVDRLAGFSSRLPPEQAEAHFSRLAGQLLELLRTIDLAIGQRGAASGQLLASRLELLDTLLVPPLLEPLVADRAQAWLVKTLSRPLEDLELIETSELLGGLVKALS